MPCRIRIWKASPPDQRHVLRDDRADHLQGAVAGGGDPWRYQLEMFVHHPAGEPPDDERVLSGLADDRSQAQVQDLSYAEYLASFDRYADLLRSTGEWSYRHPWFLTFLPGSAAENIALDSARAAPDEEIAFPFNLIRFVSREFDGNPAEQNLAIYRRIQAAGGVLYPPSALPLTSQDWQAHFGPLWPDLQRAKKRFDPMNTLTRGYELFEETGSSQLTV